MPKLLILNRGLVTLVDDEDFEWARAFRWFANTASYVYRTAWINGKRKNTLLHREILSVPSGIEVDHINFDHLDNRRENIRRATRSQNEQNKRGPHPSNLSGVRGIETVRNRGGSISYCAVVWISGKRIRLGYYKTIENATAAVKAGRARLMTHAAECTSEGLRA